MKNITKDLIYIVGLCTACLYGQVQAQDAIALAPEAPPPPQEELDVLAPPPVAPVPEVLAPSPASAVEPPATPAVGYTITPTAKILAGAPQVGPAHIAPGAIQEEPTPAVQPTLTPIIAVAPHHQGLSPKITTLLQWFKWAQAHPTHITSEDLATLRQLIMNASTQIIDPATQNTFATELVNIFTQQKQLSPAGKQLFSTIAQYKSRIKFLSANQIDYVINTMVPAMHQAAISITAAPQLVQPSPKLIAPAPPAPSVIAPAPVAPQQVSYVANIKAIVKLKKASKIMAGLITLLDQRGTQNVDTATIREFTNVLNGLTKKSNALGPTLRTQFAQLLAKAYHSNFVAANQKPHINALYNSLVSQKGTRRR